MKRLPSITGAPVDPVELTVRQLLYDAGELLQTGAHAEDAPRLFLEARKAVARLKLGSRTPEVVSPRQRKSSLLLATPSSTENIVEKFKIVGSVLAGSIWGEISAAEAAHRPWELDRLTKYLLYMPTTDAWALYVEKRRTMAAALVSTLHPTLTQYSEAIAVFVKADLDIIAVAVEGTPVSTFVWKNPVHDVLERLSQLVAKAYAPPLAEIVAKAVDHLTTDVNAWMAKGASTHKAAVNFGDHRFQRNKKRAFEYRYAAPEHHVTLPPSASASMSSMARLNVRLNSITAARASLTQGGRANNVKVLLADPVMHGTWRFVHVDRASFDPIPPSLHRCLFVYFDELDTIASYCKRKGKYDFCVGWNVLACVKTSTEVVWIQAVVDAVRNDEGTCFVFDTTAGRLVDTPLLMETHVRVAPADPHCRIHSGQRWLNLMEDVSRAVVTVTRAVPAALDAEALQNVLWAAVGAQLRPADYIFSRYLRTTLHTARTMMVPGTSPLGQFDASGLYGSHGSGNACPWNEYTLRAQAETLAIVVYDMTESLGPCINSGAFTELLRLYAQVFQEELAAFSTSLTAHVVENALSLDSVLESAIGLLLLLETWRHTRTKLHPPVDTSSVAALWTVETLDKIDRAIQDMLTTSLHVVHTLVVYECTSMYLPNVVEHDWSAVKPYFGDTRITAGVQGLGLRLSRLVTKVKTSSSLSTGHPLSRAPLLALLGSLFLHATDAVLTMYKSLHPSRGRLDQFRLDGVYLVMDVFCSLKSCVYDLGAAPDVPWVAQSAERLLDWLSRLALVYGPVADIAAHLEQSNSFKRSPVVGAFTLLEKHINCALAELKTDWSRGSMKYPWHIHTVIPPDDVLKLRTLELNWAGLLAESTFSREEALQWLLRRRELLTCEFPALTSTEVEQRQRLRQLVAAQDKSL
ncbi:hypothetical protein ACHHYP_13615 [Achlya hypogyna]|uniref:Uncharacterized protein n=1 Tax=Achlya hypogyna TaxID=1202772 RepID=A0A1V9ZFJ0_ACHHY|nr:hypothetical protein ACHHYP_13615 [Achlya hypogyna]